MYETKHSGEKYLGKLHSSIFQTQLISFGVMGLPEPVLATVGWSQGEPMTDCQSVARPHNYTYAQGQLKTVN